MEFVHTGGLTKGLTALDQAAYFIQLLVLQPGTRSGKAAGTGQLPAMPKFLCLPDTRK